MSKRDFVPRILIIDDLFGRIVPDGRNEERANLCGQYLIEDVTGDEVGRGTPRKIKKPVARAVFFRGQRPSCSTVGDTVENDLKGTLQIIRSGWVNHRPDKPLWSMVLLDLCFYTGRVTERSNGKTLGMPESRDGDDDPHRYFGLRVLQQIYNEFPDLPVVILSSKPREEVSREFSSKGALGFLPRDEDQSPQLLDEYIWRHGLIPDEEGEIVGQSKSLLMALRTARRSAQGKQNILLRGERGTGKGLLARYIHRQKSDPENTPFVEVNSSVLTPELFASELFGYRKGAFTGASTDKEGMLDTTHGGDLFFDEIKDMLPQVQAGILRVLEERKFTPVGSKDFQSVDVRFLSATNVDIEALANTGGFRPDLLDRLREGGTVFLPPLRERKEDIPMLVEKFVREAEYSRPRAFHRDIEPEALDKLISSDWPGNVRDLRNCIFNAVNNNPDVEHLYPLHIHLTEEDSTLGKSAKVTERAAPTTGEAFRLEANDFDGLIDALDSFTFESIKPADLAGKLGSIQGAYARLIAQYLKAVLEATSKSTLENPEGEIFIHPAIKLMTGDPKVTASKAADFIKRLLQIEPNAIELLQSDPVIKEAYEKAIRLRPKSGRKDTIKRHSKRNRKAGRSY
ncbi:MAG: sigma-54-dependent Fis family transcriptional regulator [Desulfobacteraceae bacterium]|nr:sigma-54-dependent Fis family transcriptional regulator [Desulfobacteraceae bacterium]